VRYTALLLLSALACSPHFEQPSTARPVQLPRDHARMGEFKTEWWYWNGHLQTPDQSDLDFFISFTRHDTRGDRFLGLPLWHLPRDMHLGLFGLTDRKSGQHLVATRTNYPDYWAADAESSRPFIYHDSWAAHWADGVFYVTARDRDTELHLQMKPDKPAALYGEGGYVELAGTPHYVYSYTRMNVKGALLRDGTSLPVEGIAWFDHFVGHPSERSARAWDWVSLQLSDGTEYMLAQLHHDDGRLEPYADFLVNAEGEVSALPKGSVQWRVKRIWTSETSDDRFRLDWLLKGPDFELSISPVIDDQEFFRAPVRSFWEGAVRIEGTHRGLPVTGEGFLETVAEGGLPTDKFSFGR
jgi:predicted secreted hydrolase